MRGATQLIKASSATRENHTASMSKTVTITTDLAVKLHRFLQAYGDEKTYTDRPRTGGVLKGCPRGPQVTHGQLAARVRLLKILWDGEVQPQWRAGRRGAGHD